MRVLLIDNYDSFTYNLFQLVGKVIGCEPTVRRNDAIDLEGIRELDPTHVIISPGPGHPKVERDFGIGKAVIEELGGKLPILGVCLGHQGIVHHLGGNVVRAPDIVHGKMWNIQHDNGGLFEGLPADLEVMRYHSLVAERDSLPDCLQITAETDDGLIMGVRHKEWPMHGLQFHPESIGTPLGHQMLESFLS